MEYDKGICTNNKRWKDGGDNLENYITEYFSVYFKIMNSCHKNGM